MINISCPDTPEFRHAAMSYLASDTAAMNLLTDSGAKNDPAIDSGEKNVAVIDSGEENENIVEEKTTINNHTNTINNEPIGTDVICPVTGERLDCEGGYPWNENIHGSKKAKLAKTGRWKTIRGIETKSPGLIEQIEKEFDLRRGEVNSAPAEPATPTAASTPPPPPAVNEEPLFVLPENPSFTDIVSYVTCRVEASPVFEEAVDSVLQRFKLNELTDLMAQTPGVVLSFGQWLEYEWTSVEAA